MNKRILMKLFGGVHGAQGARNYPDPGIFKEFFIY